MLEIIREYSFDVNFEAGKFKRTDGSTERIKLIQNDNESTKFKFNFEEEIVDNTNVLVRLRQSTGYVKEYTMLIQNQKAEIILTNDILSESGSLTMSITLIGTDDEILTDTEYHSKIQVIASLEGDTEIMMHTLSYALRGESEPSFVEVMKNVYKQFDGAYNIAFINGCGEMFVARDPLGLRPLCWAVQGRLFAAASESIALRNMGFREINHLEPGTMIIVNTKGYKIERYADPVPQKRCFFEWIYYY